MARKNRLVLSTLTTAVMAVTVSMATVAPAHATLEAAYQPLAQQAYGQAYSATSVTLSTPIVALKSADGSECPAELNSHARFVKPRFSWTIYETGRGYVSTSCRGFKKISIYALISDKGVPPFATVYNASVSNSASNTSSNPNISFEVRPEQNVNAYKFPDDYHGPGSTIDWTFRYVIEYAPGWTGPASVCHGFKSVQPGDPAFVPCT